MTTRIFLIFVIGLSACYSQALKVSDDLVQPLNPPRDVSTQQNAPVSLPTVISSAQLDETLKVQGDLNAALRSGLAENHPTVKALRARLSILQLSGSVPANKSTSESADLTKLRSEMESLKADSKQERELLLKELDAMKATIDQLRDDLSKLKNK